MISYANGSLEQRWRISESESFIGDPYNFNRKFLVILELSIIDPVSCIRASYISRTKPSIRLTESFFKPLSVLIYSIRSVYTIIT